MLRHAYTLPKLVNSLKKEQRSPRCKEFISFKTRYHITPLIAITVEPSQSAFTSFLDFRRP